MSRFADCGRLSYKITENYKRAVTLQIKILKIIDMATDFIPCVSARVYLSYYQHIRK